MNFALILKELREKKGLTQRELAEVLNVGVATIGMWESTKRTPPAEKLIKVADYFNVSVDYLLGRKPKTVKVVDGSIEDEMLKIFIKIKNKYGESGQRSLIGIAENMLNV